MYSGRLVLDRLAVSQIIASTGEYVIAIMNKRWSRLHGHGPTFGVSMDVCVPVSGTLLLFCEVQIRLKQKARG